MPRLFAPHAAVELAGRNPNQPEVISTIDSRLQSICQGIIANHKDELRNRGISNAAVVVIKNSTAEVLAMVGSADFFDVRHQGQVNGAMSPRSPGSALKPFVYALALDQGIISPNMMIEDLPVNYSGYSPENYDRQYRGMVSVAEALKLSLNVPAVYITAKVGHKNLLNLLRLGGLSSIKSGDFEYGLPLILGSCEVELIDLTNLYACLARDGYYRPYALQPGRSIVDSTKLFSGASTYITAEILSDLQRPDFPASWEYSPNIPKVAWKTGTSYGRKDAWSVGYNPNYTIGAWVGNFSGESSPDLVGSEAAAPLLFEIFRAIDPNSQRRWFGEPLAVDTREVCAVSGMPPDEHCTGTIDELYIPGVSPVKKCNIHKVIVLDSKTGSRLCRYCTAGKESVTRIIEDWPPKIATWLERSGHALAPIPEHNPFCTGAYAGVKPVIISPDKDVVYIIRHHVPLNQQGIPLEASVAAGTREVFWFVDGALYGKSIAGERLFYTPVSGMHRLTCTDSDGRSSSLTITIQ